jgi:hypothetical protein
VPNKRLKTFYRAVKNDLIKVNQQRSTLSSDNLSREDSLFLKEIKDNPHVTIKTADKGSAIVLMNTSDYLREG